MAIITAMESADTVVSADGSELEVATATVEALDSEKELGELNGEVTSDIADVEDAAVATDELSELGEVVQEGIDSGEGISEETAKAITIAAESICHRLGYQGDAKRCGIRASESFAQPGSRMTYTKMAAESIGERIADIWKNIKAMAARIWEKIVELWNRFFGDAKSQAKRLDALIARIRKMDGGLEPKEKKLKNASLAKQLSIKKKADLSTLGKLMEDAGKLVGVAVKVSDLAVSIGSDTIKLLGSSGAQDLKRFVELGSRFENGIAAAAAAVGEGIAETSLRRTDKEKKGSKRQTKTYGYFVGGRTLKLESYELADGLISTSISFASTGKDNVADEVTALTLGECLKVATEARTINDSIEVMGKSRKASETILKDIEKLADKIISLAGNVVKDAGQGSAEFNRQIKAARENVTDNFRVVATFGQQAPDVLLQTIRATSEYVSASLTNLGDKSKK